MDLMDLLPPAGEDNPAGITTEIFLGLERDFAILKGTKTTGLPGDSVTIDGDHSFKEGKGFYELYGTQDSAEFKLTTVGEIDGYGGKVEGEFFFPGTKKEAAEFAKRVRNVPVVIVTKSQDGVKHQWGSKGLGLTVPSDFTTAKLSGGRRGFIFKVSGYQSSLLFYEGVLPLKRDYVAPTTTTV